MGFLNNTTNNVIVDAVITDVGRQFLARNDGSYSIIKFACADDEVDYSVIAKYGRTVGKERIEKCTPVFEGLTNQAHALKYKLISVSNPTLLRLPSLQLSGDANVDALNNTITIGRNQQKTVTLTLEQTIQNEATIDVELRDQVFTIVVPNQFVQVLRQSPENIDGQQRATYLLPRSPTENAFGGSSVQFTLSVKSISDALFAVYGTTTDKTKIRSFVRISGSQSGATADVNLVIDKNL
jgi:hypothetical protein